MMIMIRAYNDNYNVGEEDRQCDLDLDKTNYDN